MSQATFKFDRQLWQRFVAVFQLYLYPKAKYAGWHLLALLITGFTAVIVISMFLFALKKAIFLGWFPELYNHYIKAVLRGFFIFNYKLNGQSLTGLLLALGAILGYYYYLSLIHI